MIYIIKDVSGKVVTFKLLANYRSIHVASLQSVSSNNCRDPFFKIYFYFV